MKKILVTGNSIAEPYLGSLRSAGYEVVNPSSSFPPAKLSEADFTSLLRDCSGYICGGDEWASAAAFAAATQLEIAAFLGVGYESFIDAAGAATHGIPVTNTPGTYANSVAEFTLGLLLNGRRRIFEYAQSFAEGTDLAQEKTSDLAGHSVGIVGLGAIGTRIAEILTAGFRSDVSYFSRTQKPQEEQRLGITFQELDQLLASVESLIIMVPEHPATTGMIDLAEIKDLRRDSPTPLTIVNTARPEILDPVGLRAALDSDSLSHVAFDGFYRDESDVTDAVRRHPKVLVTPHIASMTHDARDAMSDMCIASVLNTLEGRVDPNVVNGVTETRELA